MTHRLYLSGHIYHPVPNEPCLSHHAYNFIPNELYQLHHTYDPIQF